jgi:hypothetical protein
MDRFRPADGPDGDVSGNIFVVYANV